MKKLARAVRLGIALSCISSAVWGGEVGRAHMHFAVEPQELRSALNVWAEQAGMSVALTSGQAGGVVMTPRVEGDLPPERALQMLLAGTGLTFTFVDSRSVAVHSVSGQAKVRRVAMAGDVGDEHTAPAADERVQSRAVGGGAAATGRMTNDSSAKADETLTEVVVTGTHIRGVAPDSAPLLVFDRKAIERAGVSTTAELMRKIPQNFARLDGETFINNGSGGSNNNTRGATVDLRGLGTGSTLILLNGQRLAPAGAEGSFVDVSMIPASALDRVEVLTDGGSALYGADGVAGVVNFVLRRDFQGAETGVRYGDTTRGGADDLAVSQVLGHTWTTGHAMAVYEYSDQGVLVTSQRSYIPDQGGEFEIIPSQRRQSAVLSARQKLSDRTDVFTDLLLSNRKFRQNFVLFSPFFEADRGSARNVGGSVGIGHNFSNNWRGELTGSGSRMNETRSAIVSDGIDVFPSRLETSSQFSSADFKVDGPLFGINGGQVRASFGAAARREKFDNFIDPVFEREVIATFGELFIPLIGRDNARVGVRRFELSFAARYDHYDDLGTSTNPRVGLLWSPVADLNVRGTYSTAYRVPPLSQRAATHDYQVFAIDDPAAASGTTITLYPTAPSNANLTPEEATSYTFGIDWQPSQVPELRLSATYFNIDYERRIARPGEGSDVTQLFNRADLFGPFTDRSPNPEEIERIFAEENVEDLVGGISPQDIAAFADLRLQNFAATKNSGFDLSAAYSIITAIGDFDPFIAGTYITNLKYQIVPDAPMLQRVDTAYQPVDLSARAGLSWSKERFAATFTLNYVDDYVNNTVAPSEEVSSWLTADLHISYAGDDSAPSWLRGLSVSLDLQNLSDEKPPHLASSPPSLNLGFDSTNASPRGRFIAVGVRKRW